ncbi:hypothetical protein HMPREF9598_01052 [Cutibacterium acnes HL050PA1]|nr:hypothetical protein HMPREF9598_01052 [Cutibacterium acnes HL050PA1]
MFPLPQGTRVATSAFGMRVHPITGVTKLHPSADDDAPTAPPSLPPTTASSPPDNASATSTPPATPPAATTATPTSPSSKATNHEHLSRHQHPRRPDLITSTRTPACGAAKSDGK